jgi:hypothetical protein
MMEGEPASETSYTVDQNETVENVQNMCQHNNTSSQLLMTVLENNRWNWLMSFVEGTGESCTNIAIPIVSPTQDINNLMDDLVISVIKTFWLAAYFLSSV